MVDHDAVRAAYISFKRRLRDNRLLDYKWFLEHEVDTWGTWHPMSPRRRLWLWTNGFTSPYGALYDFEAHDPELFLSELQQLRLWRALNGEHRYLVDDKLAGHWLLGDRPENRPTAHGLLARGRVHGVAGTTHDGPPVPVAEWLPDAVRAHGKLVLKHLRGEAGREVHVVAHDGEGFRLDDEPVAETALCETVAGLEWYLVAEHVTQHAYADKLYPHAPNTLRLMTLWDEERERLTVPAAAHRIGTDRSRPIDNVSAGGLTARIDPETGVLGEAVRKPKEGGVEPTPRAVHPDTGAPIDGVQVPEWDRVRAVVEELALSATQVPAIGWDVVLDADGVPQVLEANTGTDPDVFQVHRPMLADPDFARVAARHLPEVDPPAEADPVARDAAAPTVSGRR